VDKLNELAREAATTLLCCCADGEIKDKLIDATIIPLLPYLRRAYEMGLLEPGTRFWRDADGNVCSKIGDDGGDVSPFVGAIRNGSLKQRPVEPVGQKTVTELSEEPIPHLGEMVFGPPKKKNEPVEKPQTEKFSIGDRVTIRGGALVGQDMKQIRWKNTGKIFTIVDKVYNEMRYRLMADGYGEPDSYGNGCLYSNESDITLFKSFEFEEPQNMSGTDMRINLEIREREIAAKDEEIAALREENEKLKERISKYTESLWGLYDYQI